MEVPPSQPPSTPTQEIDKEKGNHLQVLKVLELLKQASHDLQSNPTSDSSESESIKALLELQTESDSILSTDPNLSALSIHLSDLKTLVQSANPGHHNFSLSSFLSRRVSNHSISRLACSIESELQSWIDRENIATLSRALHVPFVDKDDCIIELLDAFEERVLHGFSMELQDLVLRSRIFSSLESVLCNEKVGSRVREHCAFCIAALIKFNKDVFVGQVLMGATLQALINTGSQNSIRVLCALVKTIRSPLVDTIESNGEIVKIISFLNSNYLDVKVAAMDLVLEIGYFGRREAVEAMVKEELIKKLVELQRSELGGALIDMGRGETRDKEKAQRFMEEHPFASCVARFAVQLEVGEGLRQREKRGFKQEILVKVREASVSDAEAASIVAEVLWGSSP